MGKYANMRVNPRFTRVISKTVQQGREETQKEKLLKVGLVDV